MSDAAPPPPELDDASRTAPESALPRPARTRWQPLRSGLLNLFRFDKEEFPFADGRLLLRGNNGSGKSRVLALQLPFLLDGETASHRVEPDGDPAKRMEWNLLMGEHEDRLGYTWVEFGRVDEDGNAHYLTLGCGLRATRGRAGIHGKWFFITDLRPGRDFELHNEHRQPLTQDRLAEVLGERGTIYRQAREYRRAVDARLFKLGTRYEPLLELLIRLRQPKLSEKLDERILSNALSEALAPLSETLVDEIAEAFRGLEADRDELTGFEGARDAVAEFLEDYRRYVQVAARRRAERVRLVHSEFETNRRRQRETEDARARTESGKKALEERQAKLETDLAATAQHIRTLRESPEMRSADEIERARKDAETAEKAAAEKTADAKASEEKAARARDEDARSRTAADASRHQARETLGQARDAAARAALTAPHNEILPHSPEDPSADLPDDFDAARKRLEQTVTTRHEAIRLVETKNQAVTKAQTNHKQAETFHTEKADALSAAKATLRETETAFEQQADEHFAEYRRWHREVLELQPGDPDQRLEAWADWLENLEGDSPLAQAVHEAVREHTRIIEQERSATEAERQTLQAAIAEAQTEIEELRAGAATPPEAPATRPAGRTGRAGAPFWKVFDFKNTVAPEQRAGLEAALQASGLLDAWILPDGTVVDPATEDAFLSADDPPAQPGAPEPALDTYLTPCLDELEDETGLARDTVDRLLARIGAAADAGSHWVTTDGVYRLGPLHGRWSKPEPEYIGETSRAAARQRRIESLEADIAEKQTRLEALAQTLEHLRERETAARAEAGAAPSEAAVRKTGYELGTARENLTEAVEAEEKARRALAEAAERLRSVRDERDREAADLRLSEWTERLGELREHLHAYRNALAALWPTLQGWRRDRELAGQARRRLDEAEKDRAEQAARLREATQTAEAARRHYRTLEESCGKEAREILARLKEAEDTEKTLKTNLTDNQTKLIEANRELAGIEERLKNLEEERARVTAERDRAVEAFRRFAAERLLADAHAELADLDTGMPSVSRAVECARRTEQLLASVEADDAAWNKRQQDIHRRIESLRDNLVPQGHSPETRQMDDLLVVRIPFRGSDCSVSELHAAFETEIHNRKRLLDEREREVIENHLLSETATEIQRLLREAEEWVEQTNKELETRPTSTGMRLRFCWEADPEGPSGLEAARRQLRQRSELWSEDQRLGLAQFFQQRIEAERVENPSASWPERLFRALDYRRWHRFSIERQQDGRWKRLTRRTHGTGSGGEKAIALTIPQFAAAAAHYRSAAPEAPRLILLDEVFVGIDSEMRANCMALLNQFELDFIMTSEREWGCYPDLPALSICHLSTRPGYNAVAVTRWRWNGRSCDRV